MDHHNPEPPLTGNPEHSHPRNMCNGRDNQHFRPVADSAE